MPTRRQYLTSAVGIGAAALAGCTGADLPESVETPSSGWGLPQGTAAGTRTNPSTDYITANIRSVAQFGVTDEGEIGNTINAAIPDREGIALFTDTGVTLIGWSGEENWVYETDSTVLTGALIGNVVVTVLPDEVIGIQYGSGDELWSLTAADAERDSFARAPTFTEYLTADGRGELAGSSDTVCIGTEDDTGLIVVHAGTGNIEAAYVTGGTGVVESNPAYDAGNDVVVLSTSDSLIGLNAQTFEEEFVENMGISQDLFTHYGVSIVNAGAGSVVAVDTTIEQEYEHDIESRGQAGRIQWNITDVNTVRAPPSRVGTQVVFPTDTGVEAVSINAGEVTWRAEELGACDAVASSKGHLYALTSQGRVYVLDGHTGEVITDHLVDGEWDDLVVWGEYILLTGGQDRVVVLTGDQSRDGLEPLLDVLQEDIMSDRLTFTNNAEVQSHTTDPITALDDMPGSDLDGLVGDIVQQYEDGEIPYIRARNILERMLYYFSVLDLGLEFVQRSSEGIDPFTVGDNRPVSNDSLRLPPEVWELSDDDVEEYNNTHASLALAYTRRSARAILDVVSVIPVTRSLETAKSVYDVATSEFANIATDFLERLFSIITGSGINEAEEYIENEANETELPQWLANALLMWVSSVVYPLAVTVDADGEANARILRPDDLNRALDQFVEVLAQARAEKFEYGVEIPQETLVLDYTELEEDEYMERDDEGNERVNREIPPELTGSFTDTYQGITAADVPRNVTESDLLDNLDRLDSLPGNQTQAMAAAVGLQRGILLQTQDVLAKAHPFDFLSEVREKLGDQAAEQQRNAVEYGNELVEDGEETDPTDTAHENAVRTTLRFGQGIAELTIYGGAATLSNTLSGMLTLRAGINGTMSLISDQGSYDILFGVHESDPAPETLISEPSRYWIGRSRTAFDDYDELIEERVEEQEEETEGTEDEDGVEGDTEEETA